MFGIDDIDNYQPSVSKHPGSKDPRQERQLTSRFQTRPSHKEPIDIFLLRQLLAILLAHATAVDDPRAPGRLLRNAIGEPCPDRGVDFLRLLRRGDFARADGPHGLVRDDDFGPIRDLLRNGFELGGHDLDGLVAFSLLFCPLSAGELFPIQTPGLLTSSVSPQHSMTPNPPANAAFALLAMNYIQPSSCQHDSFSHSNPCCAPAIHRLRPSPSRAFLAGRDRSSYIVLLPENHPPLTVSAQRPPNLAVAQLLRADLPRKGPVGLVEDVLAAHFDFVLEVFADEEEEEARRGDDDFGFGVEWGGVDVVHYVCDRLDRAIPERARSMARYGW